jgi:hypothetical protein
MTRTLVNSLGPDEARLRHMTEELQRTVADLMGLTGLPDLTS